MNVNSKQPVPTTINSWLDSTTHELTKANIPSARLDAELMLCHMLGVNRTWLVAHGNDSLAMSALSQKGGERRGGLKEYGEKLLLRRLRREPLAYLFGKKEFYGREFAVTPETLIPRPETEAMIELLTPLAKSAKNLIDVGTGSGIIAITAALEFPHLTIEAVDVSEGALEAAKKNAKKLKASVKFYESDLLESTSSHFDIICANLPYVDKTWQVSPETRSEPDIALFAVDGGLALIKQLISQATGQQAPGSYLLLEADPRQHDEIVTLGHNHGYSWHQTEGFIVVLEKSS